MTIHALANKGGGKTAVTLSALTHRGVLDCLTVTQRNTVISPAEGAVGNPAALSVGRRNPNFDLAITVLNGESPLGLEVGNCCISNDSGLDRVDDDQIKLAKNQLGLNPKQVSQCCNQSGNQQIDNQVAGGWVSEALKNEKRIKDESQAGPDQIALRTKDLGVVHASIIAGQTADGEGK